MSESVIVAAIGSLPAFIAAVVAAAVGFGTRSRTKVIHTLVNKNLDDVKHELKLANQRILELEQLCERRGRFRR